jgi:hypothetical protein
MMENNRKLTAVILDHLFWSIDDIQSDWLLNLIEVSSNIGIVLIIMMGTNDTDNNKLSNDCTQKPIFDLSIRNQVDLSIYTSFGILNNNSYIKYVETNYFGACRPEILALEDCIIVQDNNVEENDRVKYIKTSRSNLVKRILV